MRELKFEEVNSVSGGHCSDGLVDGSTLANVGCITQAEFDLLESQLFNVDQEPPAVIDGSSIPFDLFGKIGTRRDTGPQL